MKQPSITFLSFFTKILLLMPFIYSACTTVTDTLYVQDVNVNGPINQPPIRLTGRDSSSFTISPKFFINSKKNYDGLVDGHTKVNSRGFFQVDTLNNGTSTTYSESGENNFDFNGKNLHWSIPDYFIGLDMDIAVSKKIALTGGFNFSGKNKNNLYGYRVGLGFFSYKDNLGIRFDGGLIWQKYTYDAATVIIRDDGSTPSEVIFYRDKGSSVNLNHYLSLTFNTLYDNLPVNFLLNVGYSGQSLIDYEPSEPDRRFYFYPIPFPDPYYKVEDMRGEAYTAFINLSPGVFMKLNDWVRLVFAARFFFEVELEEPNNSTFIIPMVQLDLSL